MSYILSKSLVYKYTPYIIKVQKKTYCMLSFLKIASAVGLKKIERFEECFAGICCNNCLYINSTSPISCIQFYVVYKEFISKTLLTFVEVKLGKLVYEIKSYNLTNYLLHYITRPGLYFLWWVCTVSTLNCQCVSSKSLTVWLQLSTDILCITESKEPLLHIHQWIHTHTQPCSLLSLSLSLSSLYSYETRMGAGPSPSTHCAESQQPDLKLWKFQHWLCRYPGMHCCSTTTAQWMESDFLHWVHIWRSGQCECRRTLADSGCWPPICAWLLSRETRSLCWRVCFVCLRNSVLKTPSLPQLEAESVRIGMEDYILVFILQKLCPCTISCSGFNQGLEISCTAAHTEHISSSLNPTSYSFNANANSNYSWLRRPLKEEGACLRKSNQLAALFKKKIRWERSF